MVRVAVSIYPEHADYADIRRAAVQAEALGVDVVYARLRRACFQKALV